MCVIALQPSTAFYSLLQHELTPSSFLLPPPSFLLRVLWWMSSKCAQKTTNRPFACTSKNHVLIGCLDVLMGSFARRRIMRDTASYYMYPVYIPFIHLCCRICTHLYTPLNTPYTPVYTPVAIHRTPLPLSGTTTPPVPPPPTTSSTTSPASTPISTWGWGRWLTRTRRWSCGT